jgi:hypothetical protein
VWGVWFVNLREIGENLAVDYTQQQFQDDIDTIPPRLSKEPVWPRRTKEPTQPAADGGCEKR